MYGKSRVGKGVVDPRGIERRHIGVADESDGAGGDHIPEDFAAAVKETFADHYVIFFFCLNTDVP